MPFLDETKARMDGYIEGALTLLEEMMEDPPDGVEDAWPPDPDEDIDLEDEYSVRRAMAGLGRVREFIEGL